MRRTLSVVVPLVTLFVVGFLSTAAASRVAAAPQLSASPSGPSVQAPRTSSDNSDTIVYITRTGKKYHADGCRSLAKSKIPIKLKDAVAKGYTACSICKPPALQTGQEVAAPSAVAPSVQAPKASAQDNGDTIVYITRTGAKYHRAGCRSLSRSSIPIKLRDAVAKGYGACKLCNPPTLTQK